MNKNRLKKDKEKERKQRKREKQRERKVEQIDNGYRERENAIKKTINYMQKLD